jgi:hypothetical protein
MDHGRTMCFSLSRSGWERDALVHATEDWERRRSRSPPSRAPARNTLFMQGQFVDPLEEEFALQEPRRCDWDFDPMIQESQGWGGDGVPPSSDLLLT